MFSTIIHELVATLFSITISTISRGIVVGIILNLTWKTCVILFWKSQVNTRVSNYLLDNYYLNYFHTVAATVSVVELMCVVTWYIPRLTIWWKLLFFMIYMRVLFEKCILLVEVLVLFFDFFTFYENFVFYYFWAFYKWGKIGISKYKNYFSTWISHCFQRFFPPKIRRCESLVFVCLSWF